MRVFQLNTFCGVKSTGRIACEIAKLVQQDGGECRIGYGVPGISADSEPFAFQIGTKAERKVHAVIRKLFDAEGYGSWFATRKLLRELDEFRPDLIHFHNLHGCYLHLETLCRYLSQREIPRRNPSPWMHWQRSPRRFSQRSRRRRYSIPSPRATPSCAAT